MPGVRGCKIHDKDASCMPVVSLGGVNMEDTINREFFK